MGTWMQNIVIYSDITGPGGVYVPMGVQSYYELFSPTKPCDTFVTPTWAPGFSGTYTIIGTAYYYPRLSVDTFVGFAVGNVTNAYLAPSSATLPPGTPAPDPANGMVVINMTVTVPGNGKPTVPTITKN